MRSPSLPPATRWPAGAASGLDLLLFAGLILGALDTPGMAIRIPCDALIAGWALLRCLALACESRSRDSRLLLIGLCLLLSMGLRSLVLDSVEKEFITRPNSIYDWTLILAGFSIGAHNSLRQWRWFWTLWPIALLAAGILSIVVSHGANITFNPDLRIGIYWTTLACYILGLGAIATTGLVATSSRNRLRLLAILPMIAAVILLIASNSRISLVAAIIGLISGGALAYGLEHKQHPWMQWFTHHQRALRISAWAALAALTSLGLALWRWVVFSDSQAFLASIRWLDPSDQGRAILSRCYFGIPFSGNNRFLLGAGFQRSKDVLCNSANTKINQILGLPPEKIFNHAHNIWAQIAGDSGMPALLTVIGVAIVLIILWQRAYRNLWRARAELVGAGPDSAQLHWINGWACAVFLFLTSFVHSALFHSPAILAMVGYVLAAPMAFQLPSQASNPR